MEYLYIYIYFWSLLCKHRPQLRSEGIKESPTLGLCIGEKKEKREPQEIKAIKFTKQDKSTDIHVQATTATVLQGPPPSSLHFPEKRERGKKKQKKKNSRKRVRVGCLIIFIRSSNSALPKKIKIKITNACVCSAFSPIRVFLSQCTKENKRERRKKKSPTLKIHSPICPHPFDESQWGTLLR